MKHIKKLSLTIVIIFLSTGMAFGASYKALTKDNEVASKDMVQVEETEIVDQKTTYTLSYLYTLKAVKLAKIAILESEIADIDILIPLVNAEAGKVALKEEP